MTSDVAELELTDAVPASTPRARQLAPFADIPEPEPSDEEPPPISGAVESQRFQKRAAPVSPPTPPPPPPAEVHLLAEPPPPPAPMPPSLVETRPAVVEVAADVVRREVVTGPAARFVAASMAFAPATFGELLDASLDLGASPLESTAERS